jgi:uncharacterized protein
MTAEIVVSPQGASFDDMDWRASLARVEQDGPFSSFPGVDRVLTVVDGDMSLSLNEGPAVKVDTATSPLSFPGETSIQARTASGASVLNIFVRRGHWRATAERLTVSAPRSFPVEAPALVYAVDDLSVRVGDAAKALHAGDAILLKTPTELRLSAPGPSARSIVVRLSPVA